MLNARNEGTNSHHALSADLGQGMTIHGDHIALPAQLRSGRPSLALRMGTRREGYDPGASNYCRSAC